jgi:hypothetical protein
MSKPTQNILDTFQSPGWYFIQDKKNLILFIIDYFFEIFSNRL